MIALHCNPPSSSPPTTLAQIIKDCKALIPPPAPPHLVSGIFWRFLICQTLSFVTNFGNLTEQWNMCAKCNEHKYGLFSGVSVAPAAILSKVNFLTGSQVFYSCCTTPLYICSTTPPLYQHGHTCCFTISERSSLWKRSNEETL